MLKNLSVILIIAIIMTTMFSCNVKVNKNSGANANANGAEDKTTDSIKSNVDVDETNAITEVFTEEPTEEPTELKTEATEEPTTEPQNIGASTGFEIYENSSVGIKIQYPMGWMYIDSGISSEEFSDMVSSVFGAQAANLFDSLGVDFSTITLVWYDFENASDNFVPNANVSVSDASGMTQNDLKSPYNLKDLQDYLDQNYAAMFGNFYSYGMSGKAIGDNYFAIYKYDCTLSNVNMSGYQALTIKNNKLYTFTFGTLKGRLDEATYEKMLSSLEFY